MPIIINPIIVKTFPFSCLFLILFIERILVTKLSTIKLKTNKRRVDLNVANPLTLLMSIAKKYHISDARKRNMLKKSPTIDNIFVFFFMFSLSWDGF